jgi:hypothetical protein
VFVHSHICNYQRTMLKRAAYSGASALFKPGKVHGVMGSQFGDEGKGKLVDALGAVLFCAYRRIDTFPD